MAKQPNLQPFGDGHNFSYRPDSVRADQLSPRSSSSASGGEDSDAESSESDSPPRSLCSDRSKPSPSPVPVQIQTTTARVITEATFILEELDDSDDDDDDIEVIRPHAIEYAESDRSRSRSRAPRELDRKMMDELRNLNCSTSESEASDDSDDSDLEEDDEMQAFLLKQREEKRRKRMSQGSVSKRTISESIGSGSDREDIRDFLDASELGSSARRLRRKVGNRHSLQFADPPPPPIHELDEPDSSDDDMLEVAEVLAKELPYYHYISMEVDSP